MPPEISAEACAACGGHDLVPHLRVAEMLEIATAPKAFTVGYYLDRIGGYSRPLSGALVGAARAAGVADNAWAPDFCDRMMVLARGPAGGG